MHWYISNSSRLRELRLSTVLLIDFDYHVFNVSIVCIRSQLIRNWDSDFLGKFLRVLHLRMVQYFIEYFFNKIQITRINTNDSIMCMV